MTDLTEVSISTEQLLDGHLLKVHRDRVRLPDGRESIREWVDHPGAAAVVPLPGDGTVVMVRQYRFPSRRVFLEIPAGKLDLEEETGWKAGRMEHLGSLSNCIGYSNEVIHLYLARDLVAGHASLAEGEHLEIVRMPFDEALALVRSGRVEDMKTVSALMLAADRIAESG